MYEISINDYKLTVVSSMVDNINLMKHIPTIPSTSFITTSNLCRYFGIANADINDFIKTYGEYISNDDVEMVSKLTLKKFIGKDAEIEKDTNTTYRVTYLNDSMVIPNARTRVFDIKVFFMIAMVLEDNETANTIREICGVNGVWSNKIEFKSIDHQIENVFKDYKKKIEEEEAKRKQYNCIAIVDEAISSLQNVCNLIKKIDESDARITAINSFLEDAFHEIEMGEFTDEQMVAKFREIKDARIKRRHYKDLKIVDGFISKQIGGAGINAFKIDSLIHKLGNAKAKLENTKDGVAYKSRVDMLTEKQKRELDEDLSFELIV